MTRKKDSIAHTIRFPAEIYAFLRVKAAEEHRTFNGIVVHLLAKGVRAAYLGEQAAQEETQEE